MMTEYRDHNYS